jgi:hypothetical protein
MHEGLSLVIVTNPEGTEVGKNNQIRRVLTLRSDGLLSVETSIGDDGSYITLYRRVEL